LRLNNAPSRVVVGSDFKLAMPADEADQVIEIFWVSMSIWPSSVLRTPSPSGRRNSLPLPLGEGPRVRAIAPRAAPRCRISMCVRPQGSPLRAVISNTPAGPQPMCSTAFGRQCRRITCSTAFGRQCRLITCSTAFGGFASAN